MQKPKNLNFLKSLEGLRKLIAKAIENTNIDDLSKYQTLETKTKDMNLIDDLKTNTNKFQTIYVI